MCTGRIGVRKRNGYSWRSRNGREYHMCRTSPAFRVISRSEMVVVRSAFRPPVLLLATLVAIAQAATVQMVQHRRIIVCSAY
jgi:hypothetical protein